MYKKSYGNDRGGFRKGGGRSFGGPRKSFGGGSESKDGMHDAVCAACGNPCKVPFRPYPGKSIFCNACFKRDDEGGSQKRFDRPSYGDKPSFNKGSDRPATDTAPFEKRLARIEEKLDALIEALTEGIEDDDK